MNKCAHRGSMFMSTNGSVFVSVEGFWFNLLTKELLLIDQKSTLNELFEAIKNLKERTFH